jgi:exodeoxyribonuclease VII large subunit
MKADTGDLFDFFASGKDEPAAPEEEGGLSLQAPVAKKPAKKEKEVVSVSELTREIRGLLEGKYAKIWVEGEISNLRKQNSGHQYFTLKDEGAQLSCVLFKGNARFVFVDLVDGMQVQVCGEISVYEARGSYQLLVRQVQAKGQGSLQARFEELKRKLHAEGLFDSDHKVALPAFPQTICIVTSPTGAAVQDMLNVLSRRAPWLRILIYPVRVQGDEAAGEIAAALDHIAEASGVSLPVINTVVLARGGGSLEDLWAFNEEIVARAVHRFPMPIVSAVGHEIDFTIADFVADMRAPTPSAAAELIAPDREGLSQRLRELEASLRMRTTRSLNECEQRLTHTARAALMREPGRLLDSCEQQLDDFAEQLRSAFEDGAGEHESRLREFQHKLALSHPLRRLDLLKQRLAVAGERLQTRIHRELDRRESVLRPIEAAVKVLGPESTLARGYSMTTNVDGMAVTSADEVKKGDRLVTRVHKGTIESTVE